MDVSICSQIGMLGREGGKNAAKNGFTGSRWGRESRKKAAGFWLGSVYVLAVGK